MNDIIKKHSYKWKSINFSIFLSFAVVISNIIIITFHFDGYKCFFAFHFSSFLKMEILHREWEAA